MTTTTAHYYFARKRIVAGILFTWLLAFAGVNHRHVCDAWVVGSCHTSRSRCRRRPPCSRTSSYSLSTFRASTTVVVSTNTTSDDNYRWEYGTGGATLPGTDPERPQKVNQDGHFIGDTTTTNARIRVVGVMDGHGLKGHGVVQFLQRQLPIRIQQYLRVQLDNNNTTANFDGVDTSDAFKVLLEQQRKDLLELGLFDPAELLRHNDADAISQALVDAFAAAQLDARMNTSVPAGRSGTTCIVCAAVENSRGKLTLYTASVGDSRAILVTNTKEGSSKPLDTSVWTVKSLTRATTVDVPAERDRVERCEGRIDSSGNVFYGPVGIAMTRSLGNAVMLRAGVVPIPVLTIEELLLPPSVLAAADSKRNDDNECISHFICAGTDGVFDVLSNEQVMDIIKQSVNVQSWTLEAAAEEVCRQARQAWLADLPIETKVDDMTFVILKCSTGNAS